MVASDNSGGPVRPGHPARDAHGRAALLLVESLLHVLEERAVLTTTDLLDVVSTATEVQQDYAEDAGVDDEDMRQAHVLLALITSSLKTRSDLPVDDADDPDAS